MKALGVVAAVVLVLALAAILHRSRAPQGPSARSAISDAKSVSVAAVAVAAETVDFDGKTVGAGPGRKYVLLDCRFAASPNEVDFDDFQLVRDRARELGREENVGDNREDGAFYWTFLDASGRPVSELPGSTSPFTARLSFKVPSDARMGYLFYRSLYWGPFSLAKEATESR